MPEPSHPEIRESVRRLCADFPGSYWQALDRDRIDRTLEMEVLRLGRLRAIDIHPIERKPAVRQAVVN